MGFRVILHILLATAIILPAHGAFTLLNDADKHESIVLSKDGLGAEFTIWGHHGVRSTKAVLPGSGFYYFEGRREVDAANFGFGLATAAAPLDTHGGATDQSLGVNMTNGTILVDQTFQGKVTGTPDTYGFAVDYRGVNPIVHIIASAEPGGEAVYVTAVVMPVTDPIYILVYGNKSQGLIQQTINAGDHQGPAPFAYDARKALAESWRVIESPEELHLGWGEPDPNLNRFPELVPDTAKVVIAGSSITGNATAQDFEDGSLTAEISWTQTAGPDVGAGGSFTITPTNPGELFLQASVVDSMGAPASASIKVTVISDGSQDSDGDGLSYDMEMIHNTDPANPDSDEDGLSDGDEVLLHFTNPLNGDSDGDAMSDQFEALCGTLPNVADTDRDPDEDGFDNLAEFQAGTEPLSPSSFPGKGAVVLNPSDQDPSITLSGDGLGVSFSSPGAHGVRSDIAISPGSGWFYYEGTRTGPTGDFGFGVASAVAPLDQVGGATNQSMGLNAQGHVFYNGSQAEVFADPNATTVYGLAVDYTGANPIVYPIVNDSSGHTVVLSGVHMPAVTTPIFIYVYGTSVTAGVQQIINAGADLEKTPFSHGAAYHLFQNGEVGAEFMGSGWGADHAYAGVVQPPSVGRVHLVLDDTSGDGIVLGPEKLGAAYTINNKMAVRANQGMIGQFRYFEAFRSVGPFNIGQGLITEFGIINPYCCVSASLSGAPPSMSVNSSSKIWRNLVSQASYDINNDHYGFAVDYTGSRPIVYVIIGDALAHTMVMDDVFTPLFPMLYGNPQNHRRTNTANFGESPFVYDVRQILDNEGIDTTQLILGWGDANDSQTPVIQGQNAVTILEDESLEITLSHIRATDPNQAFPTGFTLSIGDGFHYARVGNMLTPDPDFSGKLAIPVTINDGVFTSKTFKLIATVAPVNDPPEITGQQVIETPEETTVVLTIDQLTVTDVDNPAEDFSLVAADGDHYSRVDNAITPEFNYNGDITVPVTVSDGQDASESFNVVITVTPVNDAPQVTGQVPLSTLEETPLVLTLANLVITDPDNPSDDWVLTAADGDFYSRSGNTITPDADFNGHLDIPLTVSDGLEPSEVFHLEVEVTAVNDIPMITGQLPLKTRENTPIDITLEDLLVMDPDNTYPNQFTLSISEGSHYTRVGNTVTPDPGFVGLLTIAAAVEDGQDASPSYDVEVMVCRAPLIDAQPQSVTECSGEFVSFSVTASGPEPLSYQWFKNGALIDGAISPTLGLPNIAPSDAGDYHCVIINDCDSQTTNSATLVVNEGVVVTQDLQDLVVCPGHDALLTVTVEGSAPVTYQWRKNGENLQGENGAVLIIPSLTLEDAGTYDCIISNSCSLETSNPAVLTVEGELNARILPGSIGAGLSPIQLMAEMDCVVQGLTWEWEDLESGVVFGQDQNPVIIDPLPIETTTYKLTATDGLSRETTEAFAVILVSPNSLYADLNGDGCNTLADLYLLLENWGLPLSDDPNGDGMVDVRDLMYINTSDDTCPN